MQACVVCDFIENHCHCNKVSKEVTKKEVTISSKDLDKFLKAFKKGKFGTKILGAAFYDHFNLQKIADQSSLNHIWAKDGEHAINSIKAIFNII